MKKTQVEFPPNYRQAECCATCKFSQDQVEEDDLDADFFQCKLYKDFCNNNETLVLYSEVNVCDKYERSISYVEKMDQEYLDHVQQELLEMEKEEDDLEPIEM